MIPYGRQEITQTDIDAVLDVLKSDLITQGPVIKMFEAEMADKVRAKHAVAMNSATSALHLACLALGLGPGDTLWTSPNSFVASANCGVYCGANVDFVDIDPVTLNMCPVELEQKLKSAQKTNSLPKIIVVVHFGGLPSDMDNIYRVAQAFNVKIIEDASHAVGARYKGTFVGSCFRSDVTIFSFHPVKIITTGEGGLATTNCPKLFEKMELLRSHGVTRKNCLMSHENPEPWYYEQLSLGYNYRMTDIEAALGLSQLKRLDKIIEKRNSVAELYDQEFIGTPVKVPARVEGLVSSYHLYAIQVDTNIVGKSREEIFNTLRALGIGVNVHYIPIHTQPFYKSRGFAWGDFPNAENYYHQAISLPLFASIDSKEVDFVIKSLKNCLR